MRGKRSVDNAKVRAKRGLLASNNIFDAVYAPTEEVIVKLNPNALQKQTSQSKPTQNKWIVSGINPKDADKQQRKFPSIENHASKPLTATNLGYKHLAGITKQQKKSFFLPKDLSNTNNNNNNNDDDFMVNDDYGNEFYMESSYPNRFTQFNKNRMMENSRMKSSTDLSQENRDTDYLARGSQTPFLF